MSVVSSPILGQQFAFAHGRIGVLQQHLLSKTDLDRLLGTRNTQEFEQILIELKLTNFVDQGIRNSDELLQAVEIWIRKEVNQMTPKSKQRIFNILWMSGDLPLISYLLKKYHGLTSDISKNPASGIGAYNPKILENLIMEELDSSQLPDHLTKFIADIKSMKNITPEYIDTTVAAYGASTKLMLARLSASAEILNFVRHTIDISNIRTVLRIKEKEPKFILKFLLDGGTINRKDLAKSYDGIQSTIIKSDLSYFLSDAFAAQEKPDTNSLEQAFASIQAADIAKMWNIPLSIEPLFAFASLAIWNLMLLRIILIGKRNGLSPQEIKQTLPPFLSSSHYVL